MHHILAQLRFEGYHIEAIESIEGIEGIEGYHIVLFVCSVFSKKDLLILILPYRLHKSTRA